MMRNGGYILLITAALFTLAACETSFEVELPEHEPVLVVNGLFRADSLWAVNLTHSFPLGAEVVGRGEVQDATVVVRSGGEVVDTLRQVGPKTYRSRTQHPQPGRTYTLHASAPGYEPITATSSVPRSIPFTVNARVTEETYYQATVDVTVHFTDPAGEENYYLLLLRRRRVSQQDSTRGVYVSPESFESRDPIFLGDTYDCSVGEPDVPTYGATFAKPAIFNDAGIGGETYEIELTARLRTAPEEEDHTFEYVVLLVSLSEPYFRFKESLSCNFGDDNEFVEPVKPYSNVEGGFGIFAGSSAARRRIEIQ